MLFDFLEGEAVKGRPSFGAGIGLGCREEPVDQSPHFLAGEGCSVGDGGVSSVGLGNGMLEGFDVAIAQG